MEATIVETLIDFRFNYSEGELTGAGLLDPTIGIQIDSGAEQVYAIDTNTVLSEPMLLNLIPGNYQMSIKLYEGSAQVGKSIGGADNLFSVQPGVELAKDLEPLYGEVGVSVTAESGSAMFQVVVPPEVATAAGGLSKLHYH